ncbi:undecaprenyldiphospho-muramoylpentapeptide beta-N-acetylglucosaminyltransferase [soil metagenome]
MAVNWAQDGRRVVALAAGGTGGHLFPAQALAEALIARDYVIHLMTDMRVKDYGRNFPALEVHEVPSATLSLKDPHLLPRRALSLWSGYRKAKAALQRFKPVALVGFGGYPSFPPVLAASRLKIPTIIHEQNAVMGRANRGLVRFANAVASSFPAIARLPDGAAGKVRHTGNPVRASVLEFAGAPYTPAEAVQPFRILVFGGSQGARFFADFMPDVLKAMPHAVLRYIEIVQQCRPEDIDRVRDHYTSLELRFELHSFFADMPKRMADAHLVICRAGASTIAELGVIGRPAVMVPLPHALDNDQLNNARSFAGGGGGWVRPQAELKADEFAAFLTRLRYEDAELMLAAQAAAAQGRPDAAERLADLVEELAGVPQQEKTRP